MRPRPLALIAAVALSAGLGACGSDDEVSGAIPRTTPDLTIPTATSDAPAGTDTTSTTSASTTSTTATGAAAPPAAAAPATPPPAPSGGGSSTTGGSAPSGQSTTGGATGGAKANGGEFESFCSQNPGAC